MTVETPQPRDRVRWSRTRVIEGVLEEIRPDGIRVRDVNGITHLCQVDDATVEVLERADDPSKDLEGTQRLVEFDCEPSLVFTASTDGAFQNRWIALNGAAWSDGEVRGSRIVGAYPGTPAAEAQTPVAEWEPGPRPAVGVPNEPHGMRLDDRQRIAEHLVAGRKLDAVAFAMATGLGKEAAAAYVEDMPEYQTYLNHHGRTEVDPVEADRMRAMGFDRQPEFKVSDEDRALIQSVLDERANEYVYGGGHGWKLDSAALTGVVADIVYAAIVQDRKRGDR